MKTIEFQKDESIKKNVTVSVNGRIYNISNQSLTIQIHDDKPLKVKIRNDMWGSKKYTCDAQDGILLQISEDIRLTKRYRAMLITIILIYLVFVVIACYFEGIRWAILVQSILLSIYPVYAARKGKVLIIREYEND